jgi:hypothetical protein
VDSLECDNFLINKLREGEQFKIACLADHGDWYTLLKINQNYPNCHIDTFGRSLRYILYREDIEKDYDLILFYTSGNSIEYDLEAINTLGKEINNIYKKRTTIGYFIPTNENNHKELKIMSFSDNKTIYESICINLFNFNTIDLLNIISKKHLELEKESGLKTKYMK